MDIKLIKKLISIKSVSQNEKEILMFIKKMSDEKNIINFWQDGNLILYVKGKNSRKTLIFNGHVDTVPEGNIELWKHPPFGNNITIDKSTIFGLGSSDMKGGIDAMMQTAFYFHKNKPAIDLWFSFVTEEETSGKGSKSFTQWFKKEKLHLYEEVNALIAEPTGLEEIAVGHKGNYFIKITTYGDSGHSAYPELINKHAVLSMVEVYSRLQKLELTWKTKYNHELLGVPTIGYFTSIHAGQDSAPNKFSNECMATFDVRTTPGLHEKVITEIETCLTDLSIRIENIFEPAPFSYTEKNTRIINLLQNIAGKLPLITERGSSDQCFFTNIGVPTIVFGPGEKNMAHKPNEFCQLNKIKQALIIYKKLVTSLS